MTRCKVSQGTLLRWRRDNATPASQPLLGIALDLVSATLGV
jgi:hypothetical protein